MGSRRSFPAGNRSGDFALKLLPDFRFSPCIARFLASILVALAFICAAHPAQAQPQVPPLRVQVRLVNVFVNVTDQTGAPIPGLTKNDFSVFDNGQQQQIAVFEQHSDRPLSIVLAIDTSGSVQKDLGLETEDAREFIHALLRPSDRVAVLDFNTAVHQVVPFTNNLRVIDTALRRLSRGPATALYAALVQGAQQLAPLHGRKVLIVISDGGNTVDGVDYPQALDAARRAQAMIYPIIDLPIINDAGRDIAGEHALITLSQQTGGKYYYAQSGNLQPVFNRVASDLRTEYLLAYYPKSVHRRFSHYHAITVKLNVPRASSYQVTYRTGYYADSGNHQNMLGPADGGPNGSLR
jgi:Ca-activated chloride channel family protein